MTELNLHEFHVGVGGHFGEVNGMEVVSHYGDALAEHAALRESAGVADLSFRGRLCLTGADRKRFLHGQVTNNVMDLEVGEGCYAALVTAKGRLQSDLNIYSLAQELLLDFEPGLSGAVVRRLESYIIADDVQVADVAPYYGLLTVQGPKSGAVLTSLGWNIHLPAKLLAVSSASDAALGEIYCVNQPRGSALGFDLFVPAAALRTVAERLLAVVHPVGGRAAGWEALEMVRVEAGVPRFGCDMDETNLPPETGIERRAVSYTKGCYIGQEVIARIRTYGQVAKALRGLRLSDQLQELPKRGDKLFCEGKEVGFITSVLASPACQANIALGYVRREHHQIGAVLQVRSAAAESEATIVPLPFPLG